MNVSPEVANILIFVFIAIFVGTALLTLLSLPEWIKINEWYKKKLFNALILEVVGAVVLLFTYLIEDKSEIEVKTDPNQVVINRNTEFKPTWDSKSGDIEIGMQDTTLVIGKVSSNEIFDLGLFNTIKTSTVDSKDYALMEFRQQNNWRNTRGKIDECPFEYEVYSNLEKGKLCYRIKDKATQKVLVDSSNSSKIDDFATDNRIHHVLRYDNPEMNITEYYLYRITDANLQQGNLYVQVLLLKIKPSLEKDPLRNQV